MPISNENIMNGLVISMFILLFVKSCILELNAPNKASPTKHADPMANPLPIAAVVLPAESNASVISQTLSPNSAISQIPPALSDTGPYTSMAKLTAKLDNIPIAANANPKKPSNFVVISIVIDIHITGINVDM